MKIATPIPRRHGSPTDPLTDPRFATGAQLPSRVERAGATRRGPGAGQQRQRDRRDREVVKKISRQSTTSSSPPSAGPADEAIALPIAHTASARARCRGSAQGKYRSSAVDLTVIEYSRVCTETSAQRPRARITVTGRVRGRADLPRAVRVGGPDRPVGAPRVREATRGPNVETPRASRGDLTGRRSGAAAAHRVLWPVPWWPSASSACAGRTARPARSVPRPVTPRARPVWLCSPARGRRRRAW